MPLTVVDLLLDEQHCGINTPFDEEQTAAPLSAIFISNCDSIINKTYGPSTNITIELTINEEYQVPKKRKALVLETEFFSQAFNIDILIPEKAINLVQDYEQQ